MYSYLESNFPWVSWISACLMSNSSNCLFFQTYLFKDIERQKWYLFIKQRAGVWQPWKTDAMFPSKVEGRCTCVCVLVAQPCLTLGNPMDCSLPDFSIHGIFHARILEWVAISFSSRCASCHFKRFRFPISLVFLSWNTTLCVYRCSMTLFTVFCELGFGQLAQENAVNSDWCSWYG